MAEHTKNTGDDILWLIAIVVFLAVIWWVFGETISTFVYSLLRFQNAVLVEIYHWLPAPVQRWTWELTTALRRFRPEDLDSLSTALGAGGKFWLPLETVVFSVFAWMLTRRGAPRHRYRRRIDLKFLIRENAKYWPALRPVANLDLLSMDPDQGPWARAKSEYQFAIEHGILQTRAGGRIHDGDFRRAEKDYLDPQTTIDYVFDRARARQVMRNQLKMAGGGQLPEVWSGFDAVDPVTAWVCAICLAFLCGDEKTANWLIDQANTHYHFDPKSGDIRLGLPLRAVSRTIRRFEKHELTAHCLDGRHFTLTVVSTLWQEAKRKVGRRLVTNRMRWLKTVDRVLFYTLNQIGRQTPWIEAAMVRALLVVENDVLRYHKATGKLPEHEGASLIDAIRDAAVEKSVYALEKTLEEQRWFTTIRNEAS